MDRGHVEIAVESQHAKGTRGQKEEYDVANTEHTP